MNIEIDKSKFVNIEGLTEASVMSPDRDLKVIIRYANAAASYLPDEIQCDDDSTHPLHQLRDACFHELCRRHGEDYMLDDGAESPSGHLMVAS